jgi:hypothetical protein
VSVRWPLDYQRTGADNGKLRGTPCAFLAVVRSRCFLLESAPPAQGSFQL